MRLLHVVCASLLPVATLVAACGSPGPTPVPGVTFALPTAAPEDYPTEPPPGTIPPGFVFPVPAPLTEGNADIYAQRALFHRTGSLCFTQVDPEGGIDITVIEDMAAKLAGREGLLEDRRTYVGSLQDSLEALDLEPTGVVIEDVAYGIGVVAPEHAMPQLPTGTVWAPRLDGFELADGRTGWTLSGSWVAVVDRPCSVLPTTPGLTSAYPVRPMTATKRPDTLARQRANELIHAWDGRSRSIGDPLGSLLGRVSTVDQVGVEERVEALKRRSIKKASKLWALDLAIRMMDLTTLEGKDTPGKIRAMCVKAMHPKPGDPTIPSVAAVCVYPAHVAEAKDALKGSGVKVASVATGFPSGQTFRDIKLAETRAAVEAGADEIDMVIDRGAFLTGDYATVFEEIVEVKEAAGEQHLKVILETGELETYDNVRRASILAMAAGADFIKTSTGKVEPAATMPVTLVMLEAIRDFERATGRQVGMKPAGGIRTAKEAIQYLVILYETLGPRWMSPDWFRFGASSLLNDVLMQIEFQRTGRYQDPDYFTLD